MRQGRSEEYQGLSTTHAEESTKVSNQRTLTWTSGPQSNSSRNYMQVSHEEKPNVRQPLA